MRIWCDMFSPSGNPIGDGPIWSVISVKSSSKLDKSGVFTVSFPATDYRTASLLQIENRVKVYIRDSETTRLLVDGRIRDISLSEQSNQKLINISGPDLMDDLKRTNTLLARTYSNVTVSSVLSSLLELSGWSLTDVGGGLTRTISARFDGASILKAIQEIASQQGIHFRLGTSNNLEVGNLGNIAPFVLVNPAGIGERHQNSQDVSLIEQISVVQNSEEICNWLLPVGQGEGESALTLAQSTRSSPYTIQSTTGPNGKLIYFIADEASISQFNTIQKVVTFREIGAVSNTDADITLAANALYDAAANWLQRNSQPLITYKVTTSSIPSEIKPGDKIRVVYKGMVTDDQGREFTYVDLNDDFWIMSVTNNFGQEGRRVTLELSNIDRHPVTPETLIIGALENIQLANTRIQTYPSVRSFVWDRDVANGFPARCPIKLTNSTTQLNRCVVNFSTRPFRSNTIGVSGGGATVGTTGSGGSTSVTSSAGGGQTSSGGGAVNTQTGNYLGIPGGDHTHPFSLTNHTHTVSDHTHTVNIPDHTHSIIIPDHTHDVQYGIFDDSQYPTNISLFVNGVDRTADLGGPWATSGGPVDVDVEISQYLINAGGGLRQKHNIEFRCDSGRGQIEVTVELYETIQAIALS